MGPPGLGKTMLAININTKHIQLGASARFITAQHLANQLGGSSTSLGRSSRWRPRLACDVVALDELGYLPTQPGFGLALYELIAGRYRTSSDPSATGKVRAARSSRSWTGSGEQRSIASPVCSTVKLSSSRKLSGTH